MRCKREALSMKSLNGEEMSEAVDKMSCDETMTMVLTLLFDEIVSYEKTFLAEQLSEYRQTLTPACLNKNKTQSFSVPMEMTSLPELQCFHELKRHTGWEFHLPADSTMPSRLEDGSQTKEQSLALQGRGLLWGQSPHTVKQSLITVSMSESARSIYGCRKTT